MPPATITIPQPCAESWAAMMPTTTGRHCVACQKTVVDFSQKTDDEILAALARAVGGGVCGRFRVEQLNRPLHQPAASSWRTWLGALLTAGSLGTLPALRSTAQTSPSSSYASGGPEPTASLVPKAVPAASLPPLGRSSLAQSPVLAPAPDASKANKSDSLLLRGVVRDAGTGEALPGVTVLIKNTLTGTFTNAAGEFKLPLAPGSRQVSLRIASVGYETAEQTVAIAPDATSASLALAPVVLQASTMMLGEMIGGVSIKPYPWHPRTFWFWLTRPFRRY